MATSPILTLHDPATSQRFHAEGLWRRDTYYSLLRDNARRVPSRPALRDGARRVSWGELCDLVDGLAAALAAAGLRPGNRVSVWLPNRIEGVATILACSRNGYVCNASLHQNYTVGEIVDLLRRIDAAALVAQPGYGADADRRCVFEAARALPSIRVLYHVDPHRSSVPPKEGVAPFPEAGAIGRPESPPVLDPDKIVCLAFTSGTTGVPKGVLHSDNTLLANGRSLIADWKHPEDTVLSCLSPMSHAIGTIALSQALLGAFELVLNSPPPGTRPLDWILETGATYVMGVPTHAIDILADLRRRGLARIGAVRVFYMGGSAITRETAEALLAQGIMPQNVYGMTENGATQYTRPDDGTAAITQTVGRPCHGYEVRIFNSDDADLEAATGEVGEIGGRGACLMLGYFSDQLATESSFNRDGWFMSGDLGRVDEKGYLQVVGRKKDIIIRGGRNIYPARIEALAARHPGVLKTAAFPVADPRLGEKVCIALIARDGERVTPDEFLAFLDGQGLSKYDMPEYFIALDELPMTPSGKILKRDLVEWARSGRIAPSPVRWPAEKSRVKEPS